MTTGLEVGPLVVEGYGAVKGAIGFGKKYIKEMKLHFPTKFRRTIWRILCETGNC